MADLKLKFSDFFRPKLKNTIFTANCDLCCSFKIQRCLTPQNDCQHLSFVKNIYVVGEKMTKNDRKKPNL